MATAKFGIGELVVHNRFGYRGVIFGIDATFNLSEEWYETVARSRPPKDQPWYHVLVHEGAHSTYVAERHLEVALDRSQIDHPWLGKHFRSFDGERYLPRARTH